MWTVDNQDDKSTSLHDQRKLVDVLHDIFDTAAEYNRNGSLNVVDTQTEPNFPIFVCDGCERCDVCTFIRPLGYFAPVLTMIFKYILGDGQCNRGPLVVDVGANMGYFSAYAAALGCKVASFEPNKHPRQYLEATAALLDPNHMLWKVYPMAIGEEVDWYTYYPPISTIFSIKWVDHHNKFSMRSTMYVNIKNYILNAYNIGFISMWIYAFTIDL